MSEQPAPYQHVQPTAEADVQDGVYRVVGTPDGEVTLLRVTNAAGHRRHTGTVVQVSSSTFKTAFEPASNPDSGFSLSAIVDRVVTGVKGVYWFVRP
ncbi:hypothetical protein ACFR9U_11505 [Halorientalis brevis]|uniref:Uncharacterized protein n=1 Tax=Halorientalis brevis TaxID=1126241 RepID=A0ABD6CCT6_9EURY|nr:hypothetical protein [Halorientalis brevis]